MKKIIFITIVGFAVLVLMLGESSQDEKSDGLYSNDRFISSEQDVEFCAKTDGKEEISWLMKQANTAVEIDLNEAKSLSISKIKALTLNYPLKGKLNLAIGTDTASWETLGYELVEQPCIDSDEVLNFIYYVKSPYSKKSKDGLISLNMSNNTFNNLQAYLEEYSDIPVYGLLWESVPGREVDIGWAIKIEGKDFKAESSISGSKKSDKIDQIFQLASDIAYDLKRFAMKAWNNPKKLASDIANDLERFAKKAWKSAKNLF